MPAVIRVVNPSGQFEDHWIESPVIRIGSHSDCDVRLLSNQVPPHALTVEYRKGQYTAFNRSESSLRKGSSEFAANTKSTWINGETMQFPGVADLVLMIDRDPAPGPRPNTSIPSTSFESSVCEEQLDCPTDVLEANERPGSNSASATGNGFGAKEKLQLAVTIACFVGIIGIIAIKLMPEAKKIGTEEKVSFDDVVKNFTTLKIEDGKLREIFHKVQNANLILSRGELTKGVEELCQARDALQTRMPATGKFAKDGFEEELFRYIVQRVDEPAKK